MSCELDLFVFNEDGGGSHPITRGNIPTILVRWKRLESRYAPHLEIYYEFVDFDDVQKWEALRCRI